MSSRTAGPWPADGVSRGARAVQRAGRQVADARRQRDAANKALTDCRNAHDELVAALRDIVAAVETAAPDDAGDTVMANITSFARAALSRLTPLPRIEK